MPKHSAGILMYRRASAFEVLLVHPGGPFWAKKDLGAWSIPKGEILEDEDPRDAAVRELEEETGCRISAELSPLGDIKQRGGKIVTAFACESDFNTACLKSETFSLEWPPRSGKLADFPEVDRAAWFSIDQAREKILEGQLPFLDRLLKLLG